MNFFTDNDLDIPILTLELPATSCNVFSWIYTIKSPDFLVKNNVLHSELIVREADALLFQSVS